MKFSHLRPLLGVFLAAVVGQAQRGPVLDTDIAVRSGIDDAEKLKRDHDPAYDQDLSKHRRIFFLAHVQEEKNGIDLIKPVDAIALAKEVTLRLKAQGFRPVQPEQKPEMVITVKYGRGSLVSNPYTDSDLDKQIDNLSNSDVVQVWHPHEHFVGLEEKRQLAAMEKLIVQVRAWEYPPPKDPKQKEKLLWMTTMYVGDPDHTDLNAIVGTMLAKGAPYFDRHIGREDEVVIHMVPDGHVNVGTPEVVAPAARKAN